MALRRSLVIAFVCLLVAQVASAQNWSFDARKVGLGSPGSGENLATRMIDDERDYRAIVLPFGLLQLLRDRDKLNPSNDEFDLALAIEYAAAPLHYTFGRGTESSSGRDLVVDIRNARLSRDLNDYKGFIPVNQPAAEGLSASNYGKTFKVVRGQRGGFQGLYVGAGPYISMRAAPILDDCLVSIFQSAQRVVVANARMNASLASQGQVAMAITGGYRGRFALANGTSDRDGVYVAANYNYLRGFRYEDINLAVRLDTDANGLLTINPLLGSPLSIVRRNASKGSGMAIDLGVGAVMGGLEVGFGASGLGNHITWTDTELTTYAQTSLLTGDDSLRKTGPSPVADQRVELPKQYKGNVGYSFGRVTVMAEVGHGFQGNSFHGGGEYRLGAVELRGGGVYSREVWNPAGGVGLHLGGRTWLDLGVYGNTANIERKRNPAVAVSLRFNKKK